MATARIGAIAAILSVAVMFMQAGAANAALIQVVDENETPVAGFRWTLEEDTTYHSIPGEQDPATLSVRFHSSYMPVVATGSSASASAVVPTEPGVRYFVSVLPDSGHSMGGAPIAGDAESVTVHVHTHPIPTAQITVFVFEDDQPLNNAPDLPEEQGLAGFKVVLEDGGGRYGISAGQMMMDAFGNMIGTAYDEDGEVVSMGEGVVLTDENGRATIKNLVPGKYGVTVVPPAGEGWQQTSTIEGKKVIDAWVKANEPGYFAEFGPPGEHVFIGFIRETNDASVLTGGGTITGQVVSLHTARPPDYTFYPGAPFPGAWVGLNDVTAGEGRCVYAAPCDDNSNFAIPNVPEGTYQLAIWDENLDLIFGFLGITTDGGSMDLGQVPVFPWFARLEQYVFDDVNENGFWDEDEGPIPEQGTNIRWRDGTVYQAFPTDLDGAAPYDEVFPFFNWLVAEVDFVRLKATGATIVVDDGGPVLPDMGWAYPSFNVLTPQPQYDFDGVTPLINPNTGNNLSRTETGPVLTQAFQAFLGQTNVIQWGKSTYGVVDVDAAPQGNFPGPEDTDHNGNGIFDPSNGGISGIVYYATTRAENDPRFAAPEPWEPGIPRIQVNLYADNDKDTYIDDLNQDGNVTFADVDNYPFDNFPGEEDTDHNDNGLFDIGDALNVTWTDSWDDNPPTGAQGPPFVHHGVATDAYDGLRNFNQVRPGVFDGGYAFTSHWLRTETGELDVEVDWIPEGTYIVESVAPPGYEHVKEEDRNVDFGDEFIPAENWNVKAASDSGLISPPICVGDSRTVPYELSLFPGEPCPFGGKTRRLPDRKQVSLLEGRNAACDFFMFTPAPIAGHITGFVLDDLANEFDPNAPTFGEKYAPPWLPISIRDWTGKEISRVYSDEWGSYNALVPSTYTNNIGMPSGVSPSMMTVVINSPGPILDTDPGSDTYGQYITDPFFNRQYSQFAYTFQYMPGTTTYLDTPVLPIAAFAGPDQFPLDAALPDGTPVVWSVDGADGGPYVPHPSRRGLTIASAGTVDVLNPAYVPGGSEPRMIPRDYGFGDETGTVEIGGVPLTNVIWTDGSISATVPNGASTGQLVVTKANGVSSIVGITVTVGPIDGAVHHVQPTGDPADTPIQDAIDAAAAGDLILVAPGRYDELVILWKPVQLQGAGAYSTIINAVKTPGEKLEAWRKKVQSLIIGGHIDLLPSQKAAFAPTAGTLEPGTLQNEEGSAILVLARNSLEDGFGRDPNARIDGLTLTGADNGAGLVVNGYAHYLELSNNRVIGNQGFYGGGIRVGHPEAVLETDFGLTYDHSRNDHLRIHHNEVSGNGSLGGVGGGLSLYTGADYYEVTDNFICGNFTVGNGAGIGHQGLSRNGLIARNTIVFNQSFNQGTGVSGGGIYIGGATPLGTLTPGSGSVRIVDNVIQGNLAGAGDGGGIRAAFVNGQDVALSPNNRLDWYRIDMVNNMIVNNVAGLAGGGISLQDSAHVNIVHNTIAHNDSTATAGVAFEPGSPNQSTPRPAGVVSHVHTPALQQAFGAGPEVAPYATFSNPLLHNDIIWENRSFYFAVDDTLTPPYRLLPDEDSPAFWDLAVLGGSYDLSPMSCNLTDASGYDSSNTSSDPLFDAEYFNGNRQQTIILPETTTAIEVAAAFDEGGNFIDLRFGPLTLIRPDTGTPYGDYHLSATSPAIDAGDIEQWVVLNDLVVRDFDGESRPNGLPDIGADESYAAGLQNAAPVARDDVFEVSIGRNGRVSLVISPPGALANDSDADGDSLRMILVSGPSQGTLNANENGRFRYTSSSFAGSDSFTYRASDGDLESNIATVTLAEATSEPGPGGPPQARNDSYATLRDQVLVIPAPGVLDNDSEPNGGTLLAALAEAPQHGNVDLSSDGGFIYVPYSGYIGQDRFRYRAYYGTRESLAWVTIEVLEPTPAPNEPPDPKANDITTTVDTEANVRVLAFDPNLNDVHLYEITTPPDHGTASITQTGILTYTPSASYVGEDSVGVTVTDQGGLTGSVLIAITVVETLSEAPTSIKIQCPPDTDGIDTDGDGIVDNDNVCLHIGGGDGFVKMADGRVLYMFGFSDLNGVPEEMVMHEGMLAAKAPSPLIKVKEGQRLYLNLTNVGMVIRPDLFDPHTVHWHGFPEAAPVFDGVPDSSISVKMNATLTYFYNVVFPGTYMYHCHVEATEHMQMGMLGNLYVTPKQDGTPFEYPAGSGRVYTQFAYNDGDGSTGYDVDYPMQLTSFDSDFHDASLNTQPLPFAMMEDDYALLNGRGYPDTVNPDPLAPLDENGGKVSQTLSSLITAEQGERILLRLSNLSVTRFFTLMSPSIPMTVVGHDARLLRSESGENLYYNTNSVTIGGGEARDVILDTAGIAPGTYTLYTSNLNYLSNGTQDFGGMMTEIVISAAE